MHTCRAGVWSLPGTAGQAADLLDSQILGKTLLPMLFNTQSSACLQLDLEDPAA